MAVQDMEIEIGNLAGLNLSSLRSRWLAAYGTEAPKSMSRELLIRAVAYRVQEDRFGGLSASTKAKLLAGPVSGSKRASIRKDRSMKAGTRFLREWNGRTHEVIALPDGQFLYDGIAHRSLSAIARLITGTRWSGPAFFGLKEHEKETSDAAVS